MTRPPPAARYRAGMIFLGIIGFGLLVGAAAQFLVGRSKEGIDWGLALAAGLLGSFVGGLLISLLSGDGLALRPSGVIGSIVGAAGVTAGWQWYNGKKAAEARAAAKKQARSGRHR